MKKTVLLILSLVMCLCMCCMALTGCEEEQAGPSDNRTLSLDKTEITVVIGEAPAKLNAILSSGKGAFVWTSSDSQVAAVDQNGKVTGLAVGSATVTVTCGTLAPATCQVRVVLPGYVPVFAADPTGAGIAKTIACGGTLQLDSSINFNGEFVDAQITYQSKDPAIAAVSEAGIVTGVKAGTTQVQVVANYLGLEVHMTVEITVLPE